MTILVADNDPAVLRLTVRVLTQAGLQVATANTGSNLLKAWRKLRCRVVLSDIGMPGGMDGIAACRAILEADPGVRVFLMTGDPESRDRAEQNDLQVAFIKPFLIPDVIRWVKILEPAPNSRR